MAPFQRASMTSYSTLMVTMALSASVSKLQPSEISLTSILTSPGHSRWKPMAPLGRASMTSYPTLMVTMALTASVSKLQPSEICVTSLWPLQVTLSQGFSTSGWRPHLGSPNDFRGVARDPYVLERPEIPRRMNEIARNTLWNLFLFLSNEVWLALFSYVCFLILACMFRVNIVDHIIKNDLQRRIILLPFFFCRCVRSTTHFGDWDA